MRPLVFIVSFTLCTSTAFAADMQGASDNLLLASTDIEAAAGSMPPVAKPPLFQTHTPILIPWYSTETAPPKKSANVIDLDD